MLGQCFGIGEKIIKFIWVMIKRNFSI